MQGTISLADVVLTFSSNEDESLINYNVLDSFTGEQRSASVPAKAFHAALSLALLMDGEFPSSPEHAEELRKLAEEAQPIGCTLEDLKELEDDATAFNESSRFRWIP